MNFLPRCLKSAEREKANRIRLENEIKKQQSERKKAREAAAKARNDAANAKKEDTAKRPQRRLNF